MPNAQVRGTHTHTHAQFNALARVQPMMRERKSWKAISIYNNTINAAGGG